MGTYDDPCGIARALDVLGQRWALLVVRELLLGPKRFRDLVRGLHGVSQNVLSQRLRELEQAGIVRHATAGPPISGPVYELTEDGAALEPVLVALGRWGRRRPRTAAGPMSPDALLMALRTTFDPQAAGDLAIEVELRVGDDRATLTVEAGRLAMRRGPAPYPDAIITGDVAGIRTLVYRGTETTGVTVDGDREAVQRLIAALR
ncbi:winged helix-turn-helix transcriptional regulator [Planobispora siamensis]|uniref:Transcriptional regulator n=1 Tax=Planobispora siamensis TaxID=936338 RepID=A0A8J3SNW9_9ACTN|nr:winged helix-turn-helix transcriptional regulator [Planobispora siamensis]GIH96720.1 transcriptional regulator [Planobispora siamensis]